METIIKVDHSKENPYLQISRKTIRDPDLDLQAKGLLVFLLDKPTDWRIRPDALAKELKVGQATIYRILNRLIEQGYIHREIFRRNNKGQFTTGAIYLVFETKDACLEWQDIQRFQQVSVGNETEFDYSDIPL